MQAKLEAQDEVRVLLRRKQIPTAIRRADQKAVLHHVSGAFLSNNLPSVEALAIEQGHEPGLSAEG